MYASDRSEFVRDKRACMYKFLPRYQQLFSYRIVSCNAIEHEVVPICQISTFVFEALN